MPIGSILANFSKVKIGTADDKEYIIKMTPAAKLGVKLIGIPHLGFRNRSRTILNHIKKLPKSSKILDAGCGYGIYSFLCAERGLEVSSVDVEVERISALNKMKKEVPFLDNKIKTSVGSLINLPYKNETFDAIICSEVLEHIKNDGKAFKELCRVLKKGGTLIVSFPTDSDSNKINYRKFDHQRPGYSLQDVKILAEKNQVKISDVTFYERSLGDIAFKFHNSLKSMIAISLSFYPFYIISRLDELFKKGQANGVIISLKKL